MAMLPIVTSHGERVFGERAAISGAGLETDQLHPAAGALSTRPGLGAIVCLCVLGWAKPNGVEAVLRAVVGVLTLLAAGILLYDVTFGPGRRLETRGKLGETAHVLVLFGSTGPFRSIRGSTEAR